MTATLRPPPHPATLLVAAGAAALTAAFLAAPVGVVVSLALVGAAATIDLRVGVLPDRLLVAGAVPVVIAAAAAEPRSAAFVAVAVGTAAFAGPLLALHLASPMALGFGDVKLGAVLGGVLGLADPALGLVALCVGSVVGLVAAAVMRRRTIALGPALALGTITAVWWFGATGGSWR
jgi:leader peptidase (prepilin peptidase)/N-methyltransferase